MAEMYAVQGDALTLIANAIRAKTGSDDFIPVSSMASAIESISGGIPDGWEEWIPEQTYGGAYSGNDFLNQFLQAGHFTAFVLVSDYIQTTQCAVALCSLSEDGATKAAIGLAVNNKTDNPIRTQTIGGSGNCLFIAGSKYLYKTII